VNFSDYENYEEPNEWKKLKCWSWQEMKQELKLSERPKKTLELTY
jgi:hypothetical protein